MERCVFLVSTVTIVRETRSSITMMQLINLNFSIPETWSQTDKYYSKKLLQGVSFTPLQRRKTLKWSQNAAKNVKVLVRSRKNLETLYFQYCSTCDHQTWQDGDLPSLTSTHKVTESFNGILLEDHVTN